MLGHERSDRAAILGSYDSDKGLSADRSATEHGDAYTDVRSSRGILIMGGYTDQTNLGRIAREGLNKFTIQIPVSAGIRASWIDQIVNERISAQSGWTVERLEGDSALGMLTGGSTDPVVLQFVGTDRSFSERAAETLSDWLPGRIPGSSMQKQYPETADSWHIRFNSARLLQLGLTENQIIDFLESRARGNLVTEWNREDESIAIRLFSDRDSYVDPQSLILSAGGRNIPLRELLFIEQVQEPEQLERKDQAAVLSYITGFSLADWWFNGREIRAAIRDFTRETGVEIRITGSALMVDQLLRDMLRLLGISLILIYIILAVQYESLRYPALILVSVPFAWIGSLFLLYILGGSLNMLSFMGLLILTGIAVNDAILKVDFMRRYLEESGDVLQAVAQAGKHRFRPVLMTTMTTILGLLPMLIPFGDGYEFRQALATALIGGMVTSTLLTLFVIPVLFRLVNRNHRISAQPSENL
jgi:HAE1 family hydrophobic/amphiphilic exporter-1